jgi:hypothetical protein
MARRAFLQARVYAEQQTTRKQVGGRWCGSKMGAAALRMGAQVCRQYTHRSSQVKEGFFLRGKRKFNREQENPRVRGEVDIANPFGSIVLSLGSTTFSSSYPRGSLNRYHHESPQRLLLWPSSTHDNPSQQTSSSPTESRHRQVLLVANPAHCGNSLSTCSSSQPRLPQGLR